MDNREKLIKVITDKILSDDEFYKNIADTLKNYSKKPRWKPLPEERYYCVNFGDIRSWPWHNTENDIFLYCQRNCFKTTEEAEQYKRYLEIKVQIMDIAEELGTPVEEDWLNRNDIWCLYFDYKDETIKKWCSILTREKQIYCTSNAFLTECLKKIGKEDLKFYLTSEYI